MKYSIVNNNVIAEAESQADNTTLITMMTAVYGATTVPKERKKHRKHNFPKQCNNCGNSFKGLIGLGIHRSKCLKVNPQANVVPAPFQLPVRRT